MSVEPADAAFFGQALTRSFHVTATTPGPGRRTRRRRRGPTHRRPARNHDRADGIKPSTFNVTGLAAQLKKGGNTETS
uniref:hypothetical protein n=1 Tax=Nonomuraea pusilla TaxID=46177 RepID=UPI0006E19640|nr:hypothetical protein [Nonomuraea pusilla]